MLSDKIKCVPTGQIDGRKITFFGHYNASKILRLHRLIFTITVRTQIIISISYNRTTKENSHIFKIGQEQSDYFQSSTFEGTTSRGKAQRLTTRMNGGQMFDDFLDSERANTANILLPDRVFLKHNQVDHQFICE